MNRFERDRADLARITRARTADAAIWRGARPARAPAGTLTGPTGRRVGYDVYVLSPDNFERAEQAIALCLAHGLLAPAES